MTLSFTQIIFVEPMTNVQANITCIIIKVRQRYTEPKEKSRQNKLAKKKQKKKKRKQQEIINANDDTIRYWTFILIQTCFGRFT